MKRKVPLNEASQRQPSDKCSESWNDSLLTGEAWNNLNEETNDSGTMEPEYEFVNDEDDGPLFGDGGIL